MSGPTSTRGRREAFTGKPAHAARALADGDADGGRGVPGAPDPHPATPTTRSATAIHAPGTVKLKNREERPLIELFDAGSHQLSSGIPFPVSIDHNLNQAGDSKSYPGARDVVTVRLRRRTR